MVKRLVNLVFLEFAELHEPFEMRLRFDGQKLGTGAYRESIAHEAVYAEIMTSARPIAGPAAIQETINIGFKADADGNPPLTSTVITDRDYTPLS
jgi:hypothetical protein